MGREKLVLGLDFGTDSLRAVVVNTATGREEAAEVSDYSRWSSGEYSDLAGNRFRQHPLDYIEALELAVTGALAQLPPGAGKMVAGIGIDSTGSTPCAVDRSGNPLAMQNGFQDNPNAMFILWKDHTAVAEAEEITETARSRGGVDFTGYSGGVYSAEWFWAKILHILRVDERVAKAAYSWVELCDWLPAVLTGNTNPLNLKRSRCAAGHKAMWHEDWGGLPDESFLSLLDPRLSALKSRLYDHTVTADQKAGELTAGWAQKLGLNEGTAVAAGALDAHMGAVGGGIKPGTLFKIMGTSTCDIIVSPKELLEGKPIEGICGQVSGSVIPGLIGLEAGQSAFGDVYAWFKELLSWPLKAILKNFSSDVGKVTGNLARETEALIMQRLAEEAAGIQPGSGTVLALDWLNGRRTPYADQRLTGAITGLTLGTSAPAVFRALVEATAFGSKAIADHFSKAGIPVEEVVALGGIAQKSELVMQITADILGMPVKVVRSGQACALGAAMFASVAAGIFRNVGEAQEQLGSGFSNIYRPEETRTETYRRLYQDYLKLAELLEEQARIEG